MISAKEFKRLVDKAILYYLKIHHSTADDLVWHVKCELKKQTDVISEQYIRERISDMLAEGIIEEYTKGHTLKIKLAGNQIMASQTIYNVLSDPDRKGMPVSKDQIILHITENTDFSPADIQLGINILLNYNIIKQDGFMISLAPKEKAFFVEVNP